jgi:hypothetical protein
MKRELDPPKKSGESHRARHPFSAICGCFVEFLSVWGGIMAYDFSARIGFP